jgi:hypothetical protein
MATELQPEPQNERASLTLTRSEKDALRLVSTVDRVSESNLLRERTVAQVVERADEIRSRLEPATAVADSDAPGAA